MRRLENVERAKLEVFKEQERDFAWRGAIKDRRVNREFYEPWCRVPYLILFHVIKACERGILRLDRLCLKPVAA